MRSKEVSIKIDPNQLYGIYRSDIIKIIGNITTIENGVIKVLGASLSSENDWNSDRILWSDIPLRAASIEGVEEAVAGLKITQMQSMYNAMINRARIISNEDILHKLLAHLSKKDPSLLSNILGGDYKTVWLNDDVFLTCPCTEKIRFPPYTNCFNGYQYFEGSKSINEINIRNVSLSNNPEKLDEEILNYLPPRSSASDDPTWDWIVQRRIADIDYTIGNNLIN